MIQTRGCPFQCLYLLQSIHVDDAMASPEYDKVLDEIQFYQARYGATEVQFYDLTAIIKKEWIVAFAKGLLDRGTPSDHVICRSAPTGSRRCGSRGLAVPIRLHRIWGSRRRAARRRP